MREELITCGHRMSVGLGLAAAAGFGLMYLAYKKGWGKRVSSNKRVFCLRDLDTKLSTPRCHEVKKANRSKAADNNSKYETLKAQQLEIWEQLDVILQCVKELKEEMIELRECLHGMSDQIVEDVRSNLEQNDKVAGKKKKGPRRERSNSVESNSIYFTASTGTKSNAETESEGGYTTAHGDSDYDDEKKSLISSRDQNSSSDKLDEYSQLLSAASILHEGANKDKVKGLKLLLNKTSAYSLRPGYCWRLAQAYCDMEELSKNQSEKISFLELGKEAAQAGLDLDDSCGECHKWYAVISGRQADHESIQNRIKAGYAFKEHIDKAIELQSDDPSLYYLLGRWCYEIAQLGWIEKKAAATFYGTPPTSTIDEALTNFLKADELSPGYSKSNSFYIAKCYKDLGNNAIALKWLNLAFKLPIKSKDDLEAQNSLEEMQNALDQSS
ncbi:regulator of microtubule dynamics protein 3-like [Rhinoraja longicauda]